MNYDVIVVGSGFSGSILARKIAEECNKKVLVVEKRTHIAGNMYDRFDDHGILIQEYGPHYLNTNKYYIINFLEKYATMFKHTAKLLSFIDGNYVRLPFNFETVQQLLGSENSEQILEKLRSSFSGRDRVPILELVEHEDNDIRNYGNLLFEKAYKTYTAKQWGLSVDKIDKYVLNRVPMAMNYDERYLNKDFQYLPVQGFTKMFENMLNHENIVVKTNLNALDYITFDENKKEIFYDGNLVSSLIFTGPIDELFGLKYGPLPYRSLDIKYDYYESDSALPGEIVSYPQAIGYTRSTEYRKIMYDCSNVKGTVVATEYPMQYNPKNEIGNIPYYPVNTVESNILYEKYLKEVSKYKNLFLCGRLAEFKYYNMDVCIEHALDYFENIKEYLETHA